MELEAGLRVASAHTHLCKRCMRQTRWKTDCADASFHPPSPNRRPPPRAQGPAIGWAWAIRRRETALDRRGTHLTSQGCRASSCSISPVDRTTLEAVRRALLSTCCMNGQRVSQRAEGLSRWGARGVLTFTSHARGASGAPMDHQTRSGSRQEPGAGPFHSALEVKGGKGGKGRSEKRRSCGICYGKVIASQPRQRGS